MIVLVADTNGHEFVADPDEMIVYVDHSLDMTRFTMAVARGTLVLHQGMAAVPGARRLNGHLTIVPDSG